MFREQAKQAMSLHLGEAIASEMYDGDGITLVDTTPADGVPDRPSSSLLRAKSTADFDEQGRSYQSKTFLVDISSGSVSTNSLKSNNRTSGSIRVAWA